MHKYLFHIPHLARDNYSDNGYWHEGTGSCYRVFMFSIGLFRALYQAIVYDVYVLLLRYINSGET